MKINKGIWIISLFFILLILYRIQFVYPHHIDHFVWGQYTQTIVDEGYAPWVLHPLSIFGYYPLSIPSGFEFFFSFISLLCGVSLPIIYYFSSIILAIFLALVLYLLMQHWTNKYIAFLTIFVISTISLFAKVTSYTASTRIFNIVFYPLFIYTLFKLYESKKLKFSIVGLLIFIMMLSIHRMGQLSIIFLISFIISIIFTRFCSNPKGLTHLTFFRNRLQRYRISNFIALFDIFTGLILVLSFVKIRSRYVFLFFSVLLLFYWYKRSRISKMNLMLLFDYVFLIGLLVVSKFFDLFLRGRFIPNLEKYYNLIIVNSEYYFIFWIIGISFLFSVLIIWLFRKQINHFLKKLLKFIDQAITWFISNLIVSPQLVLSWIMAILFVLSLLSVFVSGGILNLDSTHYENSFLISGQAPYVIFINFLFNLNNNISVLIWFIPIGVIALLMERNKNFYHWFFLITSLFCTQIMLDWEYGRLYLGPVYSILIAIGIFKLFEFFMQKASKKKILLYSFVMLIIITHFFATNFFMHRTYFLDKIGSQKSPFIIDEKYYFTAGDYLRTQPEKAILGTSPVIRYPRIAYYSNMYEAVIAQSIFVNSSRYEIDPISASELLNKVMAGDKITNLFHMHDWLLGSDYYHGRHIKYYLERDFNDRLAKIIKKQYNIGYFVDSYKVKSRDHISEGLLDVSNRIYSSPDIDLYDIDRGRI